MNGVLLFSLCMVDTSEVPGCEMEKIVLKINLICGTYNKWLLHPTERWKSLKEIALDILTGANPCVDIKDIVGVEDMEEQGEEFDVFEIV